MRLAAMVMTMCIYSVTAMGDGMSFRMVGADVEVRATEQRAVMWLRDGTWEIHIQPIFERGEGRSAWVVPFPVLPEIHEGSIDFFDELEILTSPIFIKVCPDGGSGFGCILGSGDAGTKGTPSGSGYVKVWERGTVGELDYAVISSKQGESLAAWLETEGFEVTEIARGALAEFETEGVFFFAARLSADVDPDTPLNPVRFVLPEMDPPAYPLRLTRLGVQDDDSLELTLWVISPDGSYVPDRHSWRELDSHPATREQFDEALESHYRRWLPEANLALLFRRPLNWLVTNREVCGGMCLTFDELGIDAPETWCDEIKEINQANAWVSRFQGKLSAYNMNKDLSLSPSDAFIYEVHNVYEEWTCDPQVAGMSVLVLLSLGMLIRRRYRS